MPNSIKSLFPNFYSIASDKTNPNWNLSFLISNISIVETLLELYDTEIENNDQETAGEIEIATNICNDIINLQNLQPTNIIELQFLQFTICNHILNILAIKKLSNYQFDWITNSVAYEISTEKQREYDPLRIFYFATSHNTFTKKYFDQNFHQWTKNIFYYCRTTGGHKGLILEYLELYYEMFTHWTNVSFISLDHILGTGEIQSFALKNKLTETLKETSNILWYYYQRIQLPDILYRIAFQFSCIGSEYTPNTRREWCNVIESKYSKFIMGHFWIQLFINKYSENYSEVKNELPQLTEAIKKYHDYVDLHIINLHEKKYEISRIFTLLEPLLTFLFQSGSISVMNHIFKLFFSISEVDYTKSNIAILIPNNRNGALFSKEGATQQILGDPLIYIPEFIASYNRFLGSTHAINDDLSLPILRPQRANSIPSPSESNTFEKIITDNFLLRDPSFLNDVSGYFLYGSYQIPLQPILIKQYGIGLPYIQSFIEPLEQRSIKKVLLWQGDCFHSEAECDVVQEIFEANKAIVKRLNWYDSNKEDFLKNYSSNEYDLIWISCHGEFDHHSPQNSYLVLNRSIGVEQEENRITYDELNTELHSDLISRRLLLLNACDGATTGLNNSPVSIGLGASLINRHQSLISHQWPIDDLAGAIYGVLLSHFLSQGISYEESYKLAVIEFLKGKQNILDLIPSISNKTELIERIKNKRDFDLSLIYHWGSISLVV